MNLFARPEYESECTLFLRELKRDKPAIAEGQRAGRALLWDKSPIDLDERQRAAASTASRPPYTYI